MSKINKKGTFSLSSGRIKNYENKKIIDYNDQDFRSFWDSRSRKILNDYENRLLKKVLPRSDGWFLDIGCGFGRNIGAYYNAKENFVLVDYALNHLEMAAAENADKKNIYYIAADAYNLPFKDNVFNNGISIRLLHHLNRPIDYIENLNKIINNDRTFLVTYINRRNFFRIFKYGKESFNIKHSELSKMIYGTHPKYFERISKYSGFDVKKTEGSGFIHQIAHASGKIDKFIDKHKKLNRLFVIIDNLFNLILGKLKLSLVQFVLLKKYGKKSNKSIKIFNSIDDILICPRCKNSGLINEKINYRCKDCGSKYPIKDRIIDMRII
jgi:SAM-dependent methyltransferase